MSFIYRENAEKSAINTINTRGGGGYAVGCVWCCVWCHGWCQEFAGTWFIGQSNHKVNHIKQTNQQQINDEPATNQMMNQQQTNDEPTTNQMMNQQQINDEPTTNQ